MADFHSVSRIYVVETICLSNVHVKNKDIINLYLFVVYKVVFPKMNSVRGLRGLASSDKVVNMVQNVTGSAVRLKANNKIRPTRMAKAKADTTVEKGEKNKVLNIKVYFEVVS